MTHVNLQPLGRYLVDRSVVEMSDENAASIFPLCTVVLSDADFLDTYKPRKNHRHEMIIRENKTKNKHLCIEFWLHSSERTPLITDLPFANFRLEQNNIIGFVTLKDSSLQKYTVSLLLTELDKEAETKKNPRSGIHIVFSAKGSPSFFFIQPCDS